MQWHSASTETVFKELGSTPSGLSSSEAAARLKRYGKNELKRIGGVKPVMLFLEQFKNVLVVTLILAAVVSAAIGEVLDAIVIGVILVINAVLGFVQEYRAERALEALKKMVKNTCKVFRDGRRVEIETSDLVPGDVVLLEPGDKTPADARVFEASNLKTQEAALTGESVPVKKTLGTVNEEATVAERTNMVFMGTEVVYGVAKAIVTETGMNTQLGKIASMVQAGKEELPLERRMAELGRKLGIGSVVVVAIVVLAGITKQWPPTVMVAREMFVTGVALAVAAIPEGLPAVVTISLALGVQRMVKRNAIVRKLPAVETLGSVSVICTDKTGTLTQNRMTVTRAYCDGLVYNVTGVGYKPEGLFVRDEKPVDVTKNDTLTLLLRTAVLANNAELVLKNGQWEVLGDPTEGCLLTLAGKAGMKKEDLERGYARIAEVPFDAERKMMSTVNRVGRGLVLHVKGAPEVVIDRCTHVFEHGRRRLITQNDRLHILTEAGNMASDALRLLAFAYRDVEQREEYTPEETERGLTFLGFVGMIDPPRDEIKDAIARAREAGIRTIMVTGDNALTARAIAQQINLPTDGVIEGRDMDKMDEETLVDKIRVVSVFARVSPQHKVRIVDALKHHGAIVAMTGDGVNDAPALKKADIGVAMGISGTDVAKEASDMVLVDDNYSSIVSAVEEGRGVYDNVQKFVNYLLSSNIAEVLILFIGVLFFPTLPLLALQLLWINIATDGLPAIALGVDPIAKDVMKRRPSPKEKAMLDRNTLVFLLSIGATITIGTLLLFSLYLPRGDEYARTVTFTAVVLFEMVNVFSCRTNNSLFKEGILQNRYLVMAVAASLLLQAVLLYTPLSSVFKVVPLALTDWLLIGLVALPVWVVAEVVKKALDYQIID